MRTPILCAALAATTLTALPAQAQTAQREYNRDVRQAEREYDRNIRNADNRRDVRQARREYRRNIRRADRDYRNYSRYDYNRFEPGQRYYYADRYYRDGRYYQPRYLSRNDRIYRGDNGRYYCRRSDGTTGLIIGGISGALVGNLLDNGRSSLLGTLIGGAGGALLGQSIDRRQVVCR